MAATASFASSFATGAARVSSSSSRASPGATTGARAHPPASSRSRGATLNVRAVSRSEEAILAKYPLSDTVQKVVIDCARGTNSTGIMMMEGPDGRPVVRTVRPGGSAKNKLKAGDVCLATTYVALIPDKERSWGKAEEGWFDTEGEDHMYSNTMIWTNSSTITLILDTAYVAKK
mmetsp:Transcript_40822/g.100828  ORF Transcript_40822/g.100828 Transcript_40822/m.100828 type:complete len:175 (-) Transcript_40822:137-661(-)|eukprot:CAMPEP_0197590868 /NCGR_PEP_ID=MMETSP1326-20131121/12264_1 /TAXON_ID=1155430 /ORGANISM="Genus nov. species nov., Strain RCC2288" /LENGTH=174 /DNA_ID=CAMNT_0043156159 /DNA_START=70 /DNA_END=594 /DNA_ORIENTATION=-